jgi:dephospho-CoA kinase
MLLVGLTGGLASGKTTVAKMFQECGAEVIDADQIARTVVQPKRAAWRDLVATFGKDILHDDQTLNRRALAARVFGHPKRLKILNSIVHPRVAREQANLTKSIAKQHPDAVVIYDAALLIEAKAHTRMDRVIVVTSDQRTQIARACGRDGMSQREALARIQGQLPMRDKKKMADYLIDGTLPLGELRGQVHNLYGDLLAQSQQQTHEARNHRKS